jgi:hypothetical protein
MGLETWRYGRVLGPAVNGTKALAPGASGGARTEYLQQFSPMRGNRYPVFSTMGPAAVSEEE